MENNEISRLLKVINELQTKMKFLTKQNSLLKNQINENLDESSSMESTLNEENTKLVKLVYQLKMDNKNLCKEISDLKCMLEIKFHRFINVAPKCTQIDIAYRDSVSQTTSTLPVTASRSDKCSQTAVNVRNISAQTHSSPNVNKLTGSNLIKMRKKHDVACNKKINSIQNITNKYLFEELKEILPPIQINHFSTSPISVSSNHVSQKKSSAQNFNISRQSRYFNNLTYKSNYQFQFIANNYSESVKFVDVNHFLGSRHKTPNGSTVEPRLLEELDGKATADNIKKTKNEV
ncbi:hypothetical protein FQA39_LY17929 [Lamprigera yunnana]|nr:hypothetical protein FQA39_LY17929 [Lamprigera yunnana]